MSESGYEPAGLVFYQSNGAIAIWWAASVWRVNRHALVPSCFSGGPRQGSEDAPVNSWSAWSDWLRHIIPLGYIAGTVDPGRAKNGQTDGGAQETRVLGGPDPSNQTCFPSLSRSNR